MLNLSLFRIILRVLWNENFTINLHCLSQLKNVDSSGIWTSTFGIPSAALPVELSSPQDRYPEGDLIPEVLKNKISDGEGKVKRVTNFLEPNGNAKICEFWLYWKRSTEFCLHRSRCNLLALLDEYGFLCSFWRDLTLASVNASRHFKIAVDFHG